MKGAGGSFVLPTVSSLLVTFLVLMTGCVATQRQSSVSEKPTPGEVAFRTYCQTCHRLPRPSQKSDTEWPLLVERYGQRAKLSEHQRSLILEYLQSAN